MNWSSDALWHKMSNMQDAAAAGKGKIVYAPGVKADPVRHFATRRPIYWNWGHKSND